MNQLAKDYLGYLNISDLSEQQLMESVETFLSEGVVNKETLLKSYNTNIKAVEVFLKSHKIDINYIKSEGQKAAKYILSQKDKGVKPSVVAKGLIDTQGKKLLARVIDPLDIEMSTGQKIGMSIAIFVIVLYVNTFLITIGGILFSSVGAAFFGACIVAPLVEEYAKRFALLGNYPFIYTGIFSGLEALMYIGRMTSMGIPLSVSVTARGIAMLFHFSTLMVQKYYHTKAVEEDDETTSNMGYFVAVAMHFSWNLMALTAAGVFD